VLGIGVSAYVEITAGGGGGEYASVTVNDDGTATIRVGTSAHGQGHATSFAMIVADRLRIPLEDVRFVQSDTAAVPEGGGTGGSRSLQLGGSAVLHAAEGVLGRAKEVAATMLEANPDDVVVNDDGRIGVAGVPARALTWAELAGDQPLHAVSDFAQDGATFPFGAHVAVVEVDTETGAVDLLRLVAVDDAGTIINPLVAEGQVHGGLAAGIAQALHEEVRYDEDGNPQHSNFVTYGIPAAPEMPNLERVAMETPTPVNPLGAKGIGESGTIGATPAVHNAVIDALAPYGVRHLQMPVNGEKVWRAIQEGGAG
jgi:carbon-monoxide dehydrogenase large subunit